MPHGSEDLLPLFLSEATARMNRLDELLCDGLPPKNSDAWRGARRELHTLKGAGRMMGLVEFANVCHQAEDALDQAGESGFDSLLAAVQNVRTLLASIQRDESSINDTPDTEGPPTVPLTMEEPTLDTRVPGELLGSVSDQAVRLSFLSKGVEAMVEDLYSIARTAESGASNPQPEQVLAMLALRLRRVALKAGQARSRFDRLIEQQLASLLSIQVQPVRPLLTSLGRHAVELGLSLGKAVEFRVESTRCRFDQRIMIAIKEALLHLVRNAVDHGIEAESERLEQGKSPSGTIVLKAETLAERVRLTVSDDGRGIDPSTVLKRAIDRGLVSVETAEGMSDDAVRQLIFEPGFSTTDRTTTISGRGVGLDSVADAVRKVGGDVWIDSTPGNGLQVTLDLPISRRGESILVVETGPLRIGIPSHLVFGFGDAAVETLHPENGESVEEDAAAIQVDLNAQFGLAHRPATLSVHTMSAGVRIDFLVDRVIGEEEVFLRPWPSFLSKEPGAEALALLADGTPIGIIDIQHFLRHRGSDNRKTVVQFSQPEALRVLLIDDSRITREMFRRIFFNKGMDVTSVASGEEALAVLENREVDCVVTDIEMPGIDGLELTRRIRSSTQWEHLPVIVVSTRDRPVDRMAGLDAGADAYLAKQNLMGDDLIALVLQLGGVS